MSVLRASGPELDPDVFVAGSSLVPCSVRRLGEPRMPKTRPDGPTYKVSAVTFVVSDAGWDDLASQVADAERFLRENHDELERLSGFPGVIEMVLDFPVALRIDGETACSQLERFPASLVRAAAALDLALELSIYPCDDK